MNTIKIYGPGCAKCEQLTENTKAILAEIGGDYKLQKITDPMQFATAGVFMTPGLALDDKLLFSGRNPSKEELKTILAEALGGSPADTEPQAKSCGCSCASGTSCCGGGEKSKNSPAKKILLWGCIIFLGLAAIKLMNRQQNAAEQAAITHAEASQEDSIALSYFELGTRCPTCIRMGNWISEAINTHFAKELQSGRLSLQLLSPSTEQVSLYQLTTKALIASKKVQGKEVQWVDFKRIWELSKDEEAFKAYVVEETRKQLQ